MLSSCFQQSTKDYKFVKIWSKLNAYDILGIKKTASFNDIRRSYYEKCKSMHPDTFATSVKANTEAFQLLSDAYSILKDSEKRKQYDAFLLSRNRKYNSPFMTEDEFKRKFARLNEIFLMQKSRRSHFR